MEHCAPNRVLLHSADNHHYTYQQPPTPHILIPHNGQAKTIALCLLPPTFATATPFGQKPCATTCISNSTHEESKLYTRRAPNSTHEETKLHTRRNRSNPTEPTFFASKYMFKNSDTRTIYGSQASQRERAPVAYHQATGGPSYKISIEHFR